MVTKGPRPLTIARREAVLKWVREYIAENGISPNFREIAEACELGHHNIARRLVSDLSEQGKLSFKPNVARSIVLTKRTRPRKGA